MDALLESLMQEIAARSPTRRAGTAQSGGR
jgi:hypothetical protein